MKRTFFLSAAFTVVCFLFLIVCSGTRFTEKMQTVEAVESPPPLNRLQSVSLIRDSERLVAGKLNQERANSGAGLLRHDWDLYWIARTLAAKLVSGQDNRISDRKVRELLSGFGRSVVSVKQLTFRSRPQDKLPPSSWLQKASVRKNVLDPTRQNIGVGSARSGSTETWVILISKEK